MHYRRFSLRETSFPPHARPASHAASSALRSQRSNARLPAVTGTRNEGAGLTDPRAWGETDEWISFFIHEFLSANSLMHSLIIAPDPESSLLPFCYRFVLLWTKKTPRQWLYLSCQGREKAGGAANLLSYINMDYALTISNQRFFFVISEYDPGNAILQRESCAWLVAGRDLSDAMARRPFTALTPACTHPSDPSHPSDLSNPGPTLRLARHSAPATAEGTSYL
jgi:hypothetical protein